MVVFFPPKSCIIGRVLNTLQSLLSTLHSLGCYHLITAFSISAYIRSNIELGLIGVDWIVIKLMKKTILYSLSCSHPSSNILKLIFQLLVIFVFLFFEQQRLIFFFYYESHYSKQPQPQVILFPWCRAVTSDELHSLI